MKPAPSIVQLLKKEIPPTRSWMEPRVLPYGGIMLLVASPKAGKSFFALEMARALATGTTPFGCDAFVIPQKSRVLLLDYEVTEEGLQERVDRILDPESESDLLDNFLYVSKDTEGYDLPAMTFSDPAGFDKIYQLVEATQPNVLIVDPIRRALGSWDESKATDVGLLFNRFDKLIHDFKHNKLSILVIHHQRKEPSGEAAKNWDPLDANNASGSGRFFSDVDSLVTLYRDKAEELYNLSGHRYWRVKTRWILRHAEDPEEMFFTVNEKDDLRVRFEGKVKEGTPKLDLKPRARKLKGQEEPVAESGKLMFSQPS